VNEAAPVRCVGADAGPIGTWNVEEVVAMRLNKSTGDAIRILIACARADGALVKVVDLSATLDISMQNVFKIVHILSRSGLTAAVRGRHGGIRLSRSADAIYIGDIVRAMEQTESSPEAGRPGEGGPSAVDVTRVLDDALEAFIAVLDRHSLADMVAREALSTEAAAAAKPSSKARGKSPRRPLHAGSSDAIQSRPRSGRVSRTLPPKQ
jgi:Rrf2 family nitric oxide-sensitive transcriptional repressor